MQWLSQNWIWVLFGGGFIALHLFGHGGHGGHGDHRESKIETEDSDKRPSEPKSGHQH